MMHPVLHHGMSPENGTRLDLGALDISYFVVTVSVASGSPPGSNETELVMPMDTTGSKQHAQLGKAKLVIVISRFQQQENKFIVNPGGTEFVAMTSF
eukprot:2534468-Amphidinium_carterae.1